MKKNALAFFFIRCSNSFIFFCNCVTSSLLEYIGLLLINGKTSLVTHFKNFLDFFVLDKINNEFKPDSLIYNESGC